MIQRLFPFSFIKTLPNISREYRFVNYILLLLVILFLLYPLGVTLPDLPHRFLPFQLPTLTSALQNHPELPCSSCGLTRSIVALYHGQLNTSLSYNPVGILISLFACLELAIRIVVITVRNRWIVWLDLSQILLCGLCIRIALELNLST